MIIQEYIGRALGLSLAPIAFLASAIRRDTIFHPDGVIYRADVRNTAKDPLLKPLAHRLAGTALVRLSGALWSWPAGRRRPDVLGIALRVRGNKEDTPRLLPGDQDLLFVTASSMFGVAVTALATDTGDYLDNRYYHTLVPYQLAGVGRVYLRLVPAKPAPAGTDRNQRLALAAAQGKAELELELQAPDLSDDSWRPLATVELREQLELENDAIAFHPETSAMGLMPVGLLQAMRPAIYAASRAGARLTRL
ncbi:hypothetical protein [Nannocystis sp. SCPEA4]|uniref:hypothetical protein n=1 Tax=Nannocystis sp. SCPEA4 TaxID=2996787 RepID=UPI002270EA73|nr:hypothetical protein [Nannocystis sp. SCPEA4]MCY1061445.1 hypothetical protein [Nannocystis sp. SCPEA4]